MKRCIQCVLPSTFPGISFSEDGVCSICSDFAERKASIGPAKNLNSTLSKAIEAAKSQNRQYDAVVAFSGGKDSTFLMHMLRETFDLKLLAVTFDNGFLSEACSTNIRKVVNALNVDHLFIKYRQDHLNGIFLESALSQIYPDHLTKFGSGVCISCIRMVMTATLRTAIEKQIPMVMLGNSPGQLLQSEDELIYQDNKIPYALRRQLFSKLAEKRGSWIYNYLMLTKEEYGTKPFPQTISPLPIVGYDEAEIYRTIADLGWLKPEDVDPNSTNCRLNAFGIIRHKNQYKFHPYDYEMSELVRLGSMSREAALEKLEDVAGKVGDIAAGVEKDMFCGSCAGQRKVV
ncbi:MAG: 7-cyano-7-deazaguanine synthase [Rhodospirillales bacterium]|nr:7-cyano-7-deazaguanine synthase [Rhodospirillales bacterium]